VDVTIPPAVRAAFLLWLVAIGAGVFETALIVATGSAGDGEAAGVILRGVVFAAAAVAALRMRAGRRWARIALTVGLGVFGVLSLVVGPIEWLVDGNSLAGAVRRTDAAGWLFAASRTVHVVAVLAAVAAMFRPTANRYFRRPEKVFEPA
jgi:hypothetical protein